MVTMEQDRSFVDRRTVKFHRPFLEAVASPKKRGRHHVVLEEPGWRILLWCLMRGMARSFKRARMPNLPQGIHASIGVPEHSAESIGLDEGRFLRHIDRGVESGLWRVVSGKKGNESYLELSPRALKSWGMEIDFTRFLQVDGFFIRQVLLCHSTGSGLGNAAPIPMTPSDWRFLFQAVLCKTPGGLKTEGRPKYFRGSLRKIAKTLSLSHTALHNQLKRIEFLDSILGVSSPVSVDFRAIDHPVRPALECLVIWVNPLWFRTPPKSNKWDGDSEPLTGSQTVLSRNLSHENALNRWHSRFKKLQSY